MCFGNPSSDTDCSRSVRSFIRQKLSFFSTSSSPTRCSSCRARQQREQKRPCISGPMNFYKDSSRSAGITMNKLTYDQSSSLASQPQSISSSRTSARDGRTSLSASERDLIIASMRSVGGPSGAAFRSHPHPHPHPQTQTLRRKPLPETPSTRELPELEFSDFDDGEYEDDDDAFEGSIVSTRTPTIMISGFVDALQLRGARVSTMFRGIPHLRDEGRDSWMSKRRGTYMSTMLEGDA